MARGLTIWVEVVNGGITGPLPVIYCRHDLANPREFDLVRDWVKAEYHTEPRDGTAFPKVVWDLETDEGLWRVSQGMKVFQGLWWIWSASRQIGALVGDNTPMAALEELIGQLVTRHQRLEELRRKQSR
jgi:hypothetical protein